MEILELEKQIDRFLRDDIPLTILTDNSYLTKHQWALLISKLRGYEELRQQKDMSENVPSEYFEFSHEIPEEYPTSHEERIDLFIRLRKLEEERSQFQKDLKKYETILNDIDNNLIEKISGLVEVLNSGKTIEYDKLDELFRKHDLTLSKINFYEALYERYVRATKRLEELKQEQQAQEKLALEIENIKRELIETNIKLPNWVIRTFFRGISLPIQDTQQVANQGLVKAIDTFNPKRGTAFSTYAVPVIIHEIERNFKQLYGISWADYVNIEKIAEYRKNPQESDQDLYETTGLSEGQVYNLDGMVKEVVPFSDAFPEEPTADRITRYKLDNPLDGVDFIDIYSEEDLENIPDPASETAMEELELRHLRELLLERINRSLTEREKLVIKYRFDLLGELERTYSLKEVGKVLNVTTDRVRTIEAKAIRKLRHPRNSKGLRDYYTPRPHRFYRGESVDYNIVYRKLISLLALDMTDESMLIFMNMEGINWTLLDLYDQIDTLNEMADIAAERYEYGETYHMISSRINYNFHININDNFVSYLLHHYMKIEQPEKQEVKAK